MIGHQSQQLKWSNSTKVEYPTEESTIKWTSSGLWHVTLQQYADKANEERETTLILGVYSGLGFSPTQNTHPKTEEPPVQRTATW